MAKLHAQLFMSAGPRKRAPKENDSELGEDAAASFVTADAAFLVVCDGTSEEDRIRLPQSTVEFSSRLLAQTLTRCVSEQLSLSESFAEDEVRTVLTAAFKRVGDLWSGWLKDAEEACRASGVKPVEYIVGKYQEPPSAISFSSTLLAAGLNQTGEAFVVYVGDSLWMVNFENGTHQLGTRGPGTFRFNLELGEEELSLTASSSTDAKFRYMKDVASLVIGSDGVGKLMQLFEAQKDVKGAELLERALKFLPRTADDKCFGLLTRT